jgi:hypothetical protein
LALECVGRQRTLSHACVIGVRGLYRLRLIAAPATLEKSLSYIPPFMVHLEAWNISGTHRAIRASPAAPRVPQPQGLDGGTGFLLETVNFMNFTHAWHPGAALWPRRRRPPAKPCASPDIRDLRGLLPHSAGSRPEPLRTPRIASTSFTSSDSGQQDARAPVHFVHFAGERSPSLEGRG